MHLPAPTRARSAGRWLFLLLVCVYFGLCYGNHKSFLDLDLFAHGGERLPYQYRVLTMFVYRLLLGWPPVWRLAAHIQPMQGDPRVLITSAIGGVSLLGAMLATMGTVRHLTGDRVFAFWAAFLVPFMAQIDLASSWYYNFVTPYDCPSMMFFAVAMYLVVSQRWWAYWPVFVLAVLNRETACFITVFFAVWEYFRLAPCPARAKWLRIGVPVLLQAAVWVGLKLWLAHVYAHNPVDGTGPGGRLFVGHLGYNLRALLKPQQWPVLLSVCGFGLPFLWLQRRWIRCPGLAWSCAVILPLSFAGLMVVGVIVEIRIFADWIALVAPALALIVWNRLRPVPVISGACLSSPMGRPACRDPSTRWSM